MTKETTDKNQLWGMAKALPIRFIKKLRQFKKTVFFSTLTILLLLFAGIWLHDRLCENILSQCKRDLTQNLH